MKIIDITICKQLISLPSNNRIIADSVGVVKFSCTFDGDWDGLVKKVIFTNGNTIKEVLLTSNEPQLIPHEVLTEGKLYISAVGLADNGSIKMTTRMMTTPVTILQAGEQNDNKADGYTPELWEQVLAALGNLSQLSTNAKNNLVAAINEISKNGGTISAELIAEHNTSETAHNDLRLELSSLKDKINAFLDTDDTTFDELSELITAIVNNKKTVEQLTSGKVNVTDIVNDLVTNVGNKPLSSSQGVVLKSLFDSLNTRVETALGTYITDIAALVGGDT